MSEKKERKTKYFWVVIGHHARRVMGYQCINNPSIWYVPDQVGSTHEDNLHSTELAALKAAIADAEEFERGIQIKLASLRDQASRCKQNTQISAPAAGMRNIAGFWWSG